MSGGLEQVQFMGMAGLVEEAFKILRYAPKLLAVITFTLLLPLHIAIFNHSSNSNPRLENLMKESGLLNGNGTYSLERETLIKIYVETGQVFLWEAVHKFSVSAFSLLFTAAAVYTVACIYTGKELSYVRVMRVVPTVWKRLILTFLSYFAFMFAFYVAVFHVYVLWCIWNIQIMMDFNVWRFILGMVAISVASLGVHVYSGMVWDVSSVACVLEEGWGLGAMKKSQNLMRGKWRTGLGLRILFGLVTLGMEGLVRSILFEPGGRDEKIGAIGMDALAALRCGFDLTWLLIQIVFYFHCKSFHHQGIGTSALSDHLESYTMGKYMPKLYASRDKGRIE